MKVDAENRLLWRANVRRLDVETLRDSVLAVAGKLDPAVGGPPTPINDENNRRRTMYGFVSRRKLDATHGDCSISRTRTIRREQRNVTNTPLQRLYLLNSKFVMKQARAFAERVSGTAGTDAAASVKQAYRLALEPPAVRRRTRWGQEYLASGEPLDESAQAIFSSNEFLYVQ